MEIPYLELMNKKKTPKTKSYFEIKTVDGPPIKEEEIDENESIKEETQEEKQEEVEDHEERQEIKFLDKREFSKIDRDLILNRINNKDKHFTDIIEKVNTKIIEDSDDDIISEQDEDTLEITELQEPEIEKNKKKITIIKPKTTDNEPKEIKMTVKRGKKIQAKTVSTMKIEDVVINGKKLKDRLPAPREPLKTKASSYYMNNRKLSIEKINKLIMQYKGEIDDEDVKCPDPTSEREFVPLTHQKVVSDYLNLYTPYRGLLLLHGLGSGKTCTSIGIAEGMKTDKKIIVMTPASLKKNFFGELKKCSDPLFKKNQYWEFVNTIGQEDLENALSSALFLPKEFIQKNNGAWLVNKTKKANFNTLSNVEQNIIDKQLDEMIRVKYTDINYNGLNKNKVDELTKNMTMNPFDNSVIIIDEAHNFVSRIVNKIKIDSTNSISYIMYDLLMKASNAKIVLLTGTPIINYPNEIGILFNILRGYIKTWTFPVNVNSSQKINKDTILEMFEKENFKTYDYVEYSGNNLTITRNPYGFINARKRKSKNFDEKKVFDNYDGVKLDETGNVSDNDFQEIIIKILKKNDIDVIKGSITIENNTTLPDKADQFNSTFIDEENIIIKNENILKKRILGLTSYFKSAQESLLPSFVLDNKSVFHLVTTEMSDHQFIAYQKARKDEADKEIKQRRNSKKKNQDKEKLFSISSNYRIHSRLLCNFAFPDPPGRPTLNKKEISEEDIDGLLDDDKYNKRNTKQEKQHQEESVEYAKKIQYALQYLADNSDDYLSEETLSEYSPKFLEVLKNIKNVDNVGLHLIYSQWRTMEGIGILKLIFQANGLAELDITKEGGEWSLIENEEDKDKPKFFLHTGTEDDEKKEILLNIYNSKWDVVPKNIVKELEKTAKNNFLGEIVKIMMITSNGAEGINLKNTRFVHIIEPYWNISRLHQVIGRARRICSHHDLPEELRTVQVFLYMSTLSEDQRTDNANKELIIRDKSKMDNETVVTTDEHLYDISRIKDNINQQILKSIKETSIDCVLYPHSENLTCFDYGKVKTNQFGSLPSIKQDEQQKDDVKNVKLKGLIKVTDPDTKKIYAYNKNENKLYDYNQYERALTSGETLQAIGEIEKKGKKSSIVLY